MEEWKDMSCAPKDRPILAVRHNGLHYEIPIVVIWDERDKDYPWFKAPFLHKDERCADGYFHDWIECPRPEELTDYGNDFVRKA